MKTWFSGRVGGDWGSCFVSGVLGVWLLWSVDVWEVRTQVGHLLGPHGVDEVTFFVVWSFFEETAGSQGFLGLVVLLALLEEPLFFL